MSPKSIIVIYHADCPDGLAAAWVAWKKFGDIADYFAVFHNNTTVISSIENKQVYLLDLTYEMPIMKELMKKNEVVVLDHHISRKRETESVPKHLYSQDKSGTGLAWEYFFPDKPMPYLLGLIQEEDLWRFKTENVKEILAAISILPFPYADFPAFDKLVPEIEDPLKRAEYVERGKIVIQHEKILIDEMVLRANLVSFDGYEIMAVNSSILVSEVGHAIATKYAPGIAIIWAVRHGRIAVSLRGDGNIDVSKIAAKYGGGGHNAAAAFTLSIDTPLPWNYIKTNE
jgi:oligoribonuclease NrnB/cAMP/cGMP phosphodiesterase (DHH superfamily)